MWLKKQEFIPHSSEDWKFKIKVPSGSVSVRHLFLACRKLPPCWVLTWPFLGVCTWKEWALLSSSFYKGTNPIRKAPSSWSHLNLITSPKPHSLSNSVYICLQSCEFNMWILEGHKHSFHNSCLHLYFIFPIFIFSYTIVSF